MSAHHTTPQVTFGVLEIQNEKVIVASDRWFEWLECNSHFNFQNRVGKFTGRKEQRRHTFYWYGYRRIKGKLKKKYLGKSEKLTDKKLYETAKYFGIAIRRSGTGPAVKSREAPMKES